MAQANKAYALGDEATLRAILDEWYNSPEAVEGVGIAAELVRTIRKTHQVEGRIAAIQMEIATLNDSELALLKTRAESERINGRDLMAQMT